MTRPHAEQHTTRRTRRTRRRRTLAGLLSAAVVLGACGGSGAPGTAAHRAATESPTVTTPPRALVATIIDANVAVRTAPGGGDVITTLTPKTPLGSPRVVNVIDSAGDYLRVALPVRPNGSTGWLAARAVRLTPLDIALDIDRAAKRLSVTKAGNIIQTMPVAVGTGGTPTPAGEFYVTDLIKPPNPHGAYGPYAFGLSAHSDVLASFGGGDGQIGLHGTNDAGSIGKDASHGCIRLANNDIATLADELPLGTPVIVH